MFLVMKRFPMDDVPLCLVKGLEHAEKRIVEDIERDRVNAEETKWWYNPRTYASQEQQDLMQVDIGGEFIGAYIVIEFDSEGSPVWSKIVNKDEVAHETDE